MNINLQKSLITDDNDKKFDIYNSIKIHNDFIVLIAKKRFLKLFKSIDPDDMISRVSFNTYIHGYLHGIFETLDINDFKITKDKIVVGILFGDIITNDKLIEALDSYKLLNILSN